MSHVQLFSAMFTVARLQNGVRLGLRRTVNSLHKGSNICCGISRDAVLSSNKSDSLSAGSGRFYSALKSLNTSGHGKISGVYCQTVFFTRSTRFVADITKSCFKNPIFFVLELK